MISSLWNVFYWLFVVPPLLPPHKPPAQHEILPVPTEPRIWPWPNLQAGERFWGEGVIFWGRLSPLTMLLFFQNYPPCESSSYKLGSSVSSDVPIT